MHLEGHQGVLRDLNDLQRFSGASRFTVGPLRVVSSIYTTEPECFSQTFGQNEPNRFPQKFSEVWFSHFEGNISFFGQH